MNKKYLYWVLKENKLFISIGFLITLGFVYWSQTEIFAPESVYCSKYIYESWVKNYTKSLFLYYLLINIIYSYAYGFIINSTKKQYLWKLLFKSNKNKYSNHCIGYFLVILLSYNLPLIIGLLLSTQLLTLITVWISIISMILLGFLAFLITNLPKKSTLYTIFVKCIFLLLMIFIIISDGKFAIPFDYIGSNLLLNIFLILSIFTICFFIFKKKKFIHISVLVVTSCALSYTLILILTIIPSMSNRLYKDPYDLSSIKKSTSVTTRISSASHIDFYPSIIMPSIDINWVSGSYSNNIGKLNYRKITSDISKKHREMPYLYNCTELDNYKVKTILTPLRNIKFSIYQDLNWQTHIDESYILFKYFDYLVVGSNNKTLILPGNSLNIYQFDIEGRAAFTSLKFISRNHFQLGIFTQKGVKYLFQLKDNSVKLISRGAFKLPPKNITILNIIPLVGGVVYFGFSWLSLIPTFFACFLVVYLYRKDEDKLLLAFKVILTFLLGIPMLLSLIWLQRPISNIVFNQLKEQP